MENNHKINNRSGKVLAGVFIIGVGLVLLLKNLDLNLPHWLFSWSTLLIVLGVFIGLKNNFRNGSGLILILIGTVFTLKEALENIVDFERVILPASLMVFGIFLIFKPKSEFRHHDKWKRKFGKPNFQFDKDNETEATSFEQEKKSGATNHDYLDSTNVFGGSHQTIYSKNFKGGEIIAVFGGCDVNLSQADFEGEISIDITAIFGGAKIIVPAGWQVKHEVTAIFGGLDDKRPIQPIIEGQHKLLIVKGIALFGGVDIRSF